MKTSLLSRIIDEPYRFFFPFGIIAGILGVSHWLFYGLGWIPRYSMIMHSSIQIQVYMASFVAGFLMTAMPRFAAAPPANGFEFFSVLAVLVFVLVSYLSGYLWRGQLGFIAWMFLLAAFAARRILKKKTDTVKPPIEFFWILAALVHGLSGTALLLLGETGRLPVWAATVGKPMMDQGFLLSVVIGVGGFLGPRLMGVFNPLGKIGSPDYEKKAARQRRLLTALYACLAAALFASFILEGLKKNIPAFALRAAVITIVYFRTRTLVLLPKVRDQFVFLLWLSFWMVFAGHWALVFFPVYRAAILHIVFIGGYSVMTFAVGSMVIFSHAGEQRVLRKKSWQFPFIAVMILAAIVLRVCAVLHPNLFFKLLGAASAFWLAAAFCWLFYILPAAFRSVSAGELERTHEEAKERVRKMRGE